MTTQYSPIESCYTWSCPWGHRGSDCESQWEADEAELNHQCFGPVV